MPARFELTPDEAAGHDGRGSITAMRPSRASAIARKSTRLSESRRSPFAGSTRTVSATAPAVEREIRQMDRRGFIAVHRCSARASSTSPSLEHDGARLPGEPTRPMVTAMLSPWLLTGF